MMGSDDAKDAHTLYTHIHLLLPLYHFQGSTAAREDQ
jgi:hypothetical protein